jgi:diguanylate cyclase (GGDEF)-like protein
LSAFSQYLPHTTTKYSIWSTPVMNRERLSLNVKVGTIALGAVCFGLALVSLPEHAFSSGYLLVLAFAMLVAPRMSVTLPRSKFIISFSDALIFLTFLLYGGKAAIVAATFETLANCIYLKRKGLTFGRLIIPTNISISAVSTSVTYLVWLSIPRVGLFELNTTSTPHLVTIIGALALTQFLVSSMFVAVLQSSIDGVNPWKTWKRDCFSSSMSQIVGAAMAGLIFKLINYADLMTSAIAALALGLAYMNYRQSIGEINEAIGQVEEAERQKAETERERRREAEKHSQQLTRSLEKEEKANEALRKSEKDFQYLALHDSLTDLANRKQFTDNLKSLIEEYKKDPQKAFHVMFLDISRFKNINDSLGHTIGDKVLSIVAKRFVRMLTPADTVARIGGDEFAIILRNLSTVAKAQKVARRIHQNITQPFSLSGNRIFISINIGIAPCDAEYDQPEEILRDADIAMHYAKEKEKGVAVFTKELRARFLERVKLEVDLRSAIDRGELSMHYQPLVSLKDGELMGFEALLRWNHHELGMISPAKFIPIAEDSGLIIPITIWILEQTCSQIQKWRRISPAYDKLVVSVNISGKHLATDQLLEDVETALEATKLPPECLKLEITESTAMENAEHTISILKQLKKIGVKLSIDDFGTGYSSLSHLHSLPFDTLKIDRSFVNAVGPSGEKSEILQTIISLAKNLKMKVIAEGIETEAQLAVLQNLGCDYGQGYLLAKPKAVDESEKLLYQRPNWLPASEVDHFETVTSQVTEENLPVF